ncbi:ParB N-terminal domain-containing protein [Streptomyces sp. TR02-1]|uniref:ParB N-terminal domain-containing protein n=1 Tax=Streptomyces sp. TR02-1 TaxID=3385977 RepID=UPI0039A30036
MTTDGTLSTTIVKRDPRRLRRLQVNAQYMDQTMYQQLVANIRRDGCLTSVPLVWDGGGQYPEGEEIVLSGNHRTDAAVDADVEEVDCMLVTGPISKARSIAMQISHNALVGDSDASTLASLYEEIDEVDWRGYAGLDDKTLDLMEKVDLQSLSEANLDFATVMLMFLPHEKQSAEAAFDQGRTSADATWLAAREDYEPTLDALASVHAAHNVGNVATALGIVLRVFENHLEDLREGWVDGDSLEPKHTGHVGIETVFGSRTMPAKSATVLNRAVRRAEDSGDVERGKGWQLMERLAADYLSAEG